MTQWLHTTMTRKQFTILLALGAISPAILAINANAADTGTVMMDSVTGANFAIRPTTPDPMVPDSSAYLILSATPGQIIITSVTVTNVGNATGSVRLFPVDSTTGQTSGVVYFGETSPRTDVGIWTAVSGTSVMLTPNQSQDIPVTITVPAIPRPGQHVGGIVAVGAAPPGGGQVTISSQIITAVLINLPPPLTESFTIPSLTLGGTQTNPGMLVGLRNDGTVLQRPTVNIVVKDMAGHTVLTVPTLALGTFVPQTQINYPVAIAPGALPAGDYAVTVAVTYGTSGQTTATLPLAYYYVPTLTAIGPASGETTGGSVVTLSGFGFGTTTDTQVFLDGVVLPTASIQSITARSIRFVAPAHANGSVAITVKVGGVLASGSLSYQYNLVSARPPATHPVAPTQGPVHAGPVMPHPTVAPPPRGTPPPNSQPTRH